MHGIIRYVSVLGAIAIAVAGLSACGSGGGGGGGGSGGGGSGDVVARVGGNPITRAALGHWLSIRAASNGRTTVSDRTVSGEAPTQAVLGFLIFSQWTIGEAAELGVRVSDEEAQKQLERFKYVQLEGLRYERFPKEAELRRSLAGRGETFSDQLWLMKLNILAARIEQALIVEAQRQVTHAQIARYYDENRQRFILPERRNVGVIATFGEAAAEKAKREVQSGKSFSSVLERVSIYPDDPEGLPHWQEEEVFHKHIFAAKPHVLTGPVHQALYYVFEVTKVTPPVQRTLAQSEGSIRQRLAAQRQRRVSAELLEAFDRKWIARTDCRAGYVVSRCRQYAGATSMSDSPYSEANGTAASTIGPPSPPASSGVVVTTKNVKLGTILAAGPKLLTVYLFEADKGSTSACYGACARVWLPVTTSAPPVAAGMAIPADPGTITRSDGTKQVTYFHHPLYYYVKDRSSGDFYGQGVKSFGSRWYALRTIGVKFEKLPGEQHPLPG
jgi:predicted lipoprotein with Yx(FWY)xxD motif